MSPEDQGQALADAARGLDVEAIKRRWQAVMDARMGRATEQQIRVAEGISGADVPALLAELAAEKASHGRTMLASQRAVERMQAQVERDAERAHVASHAAEIVRLRDVVAEVEQERDALRGWEEQCQKTQDDLDRACQEREQLRAQVNAAGDRERELRTAVEEARGSLDTIAPSDDVYAVQRKSLAARTALSRVAPETALPSLDAHGSRSPSKTKCPACGSALNMDGSCPAQPLADTAPPFAGAVQVGAVWMTPGEACNRICGDRVGTSHAEGCPYRPEPTKGPLHYCPEEDSEETACGRGDQPGRRTWHAGPFERDADQCPGCAAVLLPKLARARAAPLGCCGYHASGGHRDDRCGRDPAAVVTGSEAPVLETPEAMAERLNPTPTVHALSEIALSSNAHVARRADVSQRVAKSTALVAIRARDEHLRRVLIAEATSWPDAQGRAALIHAAARLGGSR